MFSGGAIASGWEPRPGTQKAPKRVSEHKRHTQRCSTPWRSPLPGSLPWCSSPISPRHSPPEQPPPRVGTGSCSVLYFQCLTWRMVYSWCLKDIYRTDLRNRNDLGWKSPHRVSFACFSSRFFDPSKGANNSHSPVYTASTGLNINTRQGLDRETEAYTGEGLALSSNQWLWGSKCPVLPLTDGKNLQMEEDICNT